MSIYSRLLWVSKVLLYYMSQCWTLCRKPNKRMPFCMSSRQFCWQLQPKMHGRMYSKAILSYIYTIDSSIQCVCVSLPLRILCLRHNKNLCSYLSWRNLWGECYEQVHLEMPHRDLCWLVLKSVCSWLWSWKRIVLGMVNEKVCKSVPRCS